LLGSCRWIAIGSCKWAVVSKKADRF
jgi:hypothetical protein